MPRWREKDRARKRKAQQKQQSSPAWSILDYGARPDVLTEAILLGTDYGSRPSWKDDCLSLERRLSGGLQRQVSKDVENRFLVGDYSYQFNAGSGDDTIRPGTVQSSGGGWVSGVVLDREDLIRELKRTQPPAGTATQAWARETLISALVDALVPEVCRQLADNIDKMHPGEKKPSASWLRWQAEHFKQQPTRRLGMSRVSVFASNAKGD